MQPGVRITDFLNEFQTVVQQLAAVSLTFVDEVKSLLLLCLPDSWENMAMTVSNAYGNEKLKLDSVVAATLNEESRRRVSQVVEASGSALRVEARGRDVEKGDKHQTRRKLRGSNPNGHGKGACFRCG